MIFADMAKTKKSASRGREEWRILVQAWKAGGSTARAFSEAQGLNMASLFYWSSMFKREKRSEPAAKLLPVRVSPVEVRRPAMELRVGPTRVRFEGGTSPGYVAALARALLEAVSA
jgi:hypothetical protein